MEYMDSIGRIGLSNYEGIDWIQYTKRFPLPVAPMIAKIWVECAGACGIYVNKTFIGPVFGENIHSVNYVDCSDSVRAGEIEVVLVLRRPQTPADETEGNSQDIPFPTVAAQLAIVPGFSGIRYTVTDESWECETNIGPAKTQCFSKVTEEEYNRFWKNLKEQSMDADYVEKSQPQFPLHK